MKSWKVIVLLLTMMFIFYKDPLIEYATHVEDVFFPLEDFSNDHYLDNLSWTENGYRIPGLNDSLSHCNFTSHFGEPLGTGWSKKVFSYLQFAAKRPNLEGRTFHECFQKNFGKKNAMRICKINFLRGFVNEIKMLQLLNRDRNVPELYSYCIPANFFKNFEKLELRLEKGTPIDVVYLINMDYRKRVQFVKEIIDFVMRNSFLEFTDFRRQQFIQINDLPYFVDFDSVNARNEIDVGKHFHNDRVMTSKIYEQFVKDFMLIGAPSRAVSSFKSISEMLQNGTLTLSNLSQKFSDL